MDSLANCRRPRNETISEPEDISTEFSKCKMQRKQKIKKRVSKNYETTTKSITCNWNTTKREKKGTEEIFEIMTENFPKLTSDQITARGISENIKQNKS